MKLGQRIKQQRLHLGLTQEALGQMVGVTKAAINKYETGIVVNLRQPVFEKLAKALKCSPAYLIGWEDKKDIPSEDEAELIRIFRTLNVRHRAELLTSAIHMESEENK